jgi:hypothetical protein
MPIFHLDIILLFILSRNYFWIQAGCLQKFDGDVNPILNLPQFIGVGILDEEARSCCIVIAAMVLTFLT